MESEFLQLAREAVAAMQGPTQPTWTDVAAATVGFLQVGLIAWGLRQMGKSSEERTRKMDQQEVEAERRHEETRQRHEESMAALRALIERTAPAPKS